MDVLGTQKGYIGTVQEEQPGRPVTIYQASVTLTDAQVKALPTTAVEIVASPGVGTILLPLQVLLVASFTSAYTNLAATSLLKITSFGTDRIIILSESDAVEEAFVSSLLGQTGSLVVAAQPRGEYFGTAGAGFGGLGGIVSGGASASGIAIAGFNGVSGNFTGGNAANTLKITVWYGIFEV